MKTVALIEIGNGGHHTAYMRLFIGALLELDCQVICLIPDTAPIAAWVDEHYPDKANRVIYQPLPFHRNRLHILGRFRERVNILYDWFNINRVIGAVERKHHIKTDLVFMCFLDLYLINRVPPAMLDRLMRRKWSGLYFFPSLVSQHPGLLNESPQLKDRDIFFRARNCVGIGLLNNSMYGQYSNRIQKPVIPFPDVADISVPDPDSQIAREIKTRARNRIVVGTIGLEWHKCGYELVQLAKHADPNRFFFAFTGPFFDHMLRHYPDEQAKEITEFIEHLPENCYWQTGFLNEGPEYNAVINAFDIVWTVYKNFFGSSNRLTKAAHFQKLVISDNKYCIGELVSRYGLGEPLPNLQPDAMISALEKLEKRIKQGQLPISNWKTYASMQSPDVLKDRFGKIISLL